jgi:hypothetical protein
LAPAEREYLALLLLALSIFGCCLTLLLALELMDLSPNTAAPLLALASIFWRMTRRLLALEWMNSWPSDGTAGAGIETLLAHWPRHCWHWLETVSLLAHCTAPLLALASALLAWYGTFFVGRPDLLLAPLHGTTAGAGISLFWCPLAHFLLL